MLPPIESLIPVIVPAIPEKIFNHLFIVKLYISTQRNLRQNVHIKLQSYNYDTKELGPGTFNINFEDLIAEITRVPMLGQSMNFLVETIDLLAKEKILLEKIEEAETSGEPTKELEIQLAAVRVNLGVEVTK